MKPILQTESSECGIACLAMISSHYGYFADLHDLRRKFSISLKGATLAQIVKHAEAMKMTARPLRVDLDEMSQLSLPCILHWNLNHFVVLKRVHRDLKGRLQLVILDPAVGECKISADEASAKFSGVALELSPTEAFSQRDDRKRLQISELTGPIIGLRRSVMQMLALALALEMMAISFPMLNQFIVDDVLANGDLDLLTILLIGFGILLIIQAAISFARGWLLLRWSTDVGFQWANRLMAHLMNLPVSFFEKRHLGDVVSRFGSIAALQGAVTSLLLEGVLDGLMAVVALGMMLAYSVKLTALVAVCIICYAALRAYLQAPLRAAAQERIVLAAKESTHLIETIRAISPIKLFGKETNRRSRWLNLKMDTQNRDVKTQKMMMIFRVVNSAINGVQGLGIFYIGAALILSNQLSLGMLLAFSSYAGTFTSRVSNLIDLFFSTRLLSVHMARVADIVREEPESVELTPIELEPSTDAPDLVLKDVWFRYADGEPWILRGVDLKIEAGESVVLVGPSGCGKTTLCKIILGLLQPTKGEVLFGDAAIVRQNMANYRSLVGTVMQDDHLLSGSIEENISFFDTPIDGDKVKECARAAAIHNEISRMPMRYQTLVGDSGSSLSGGQKQRVLLARALYKQPKLLVMDEATSHLDLMNEALVNRSLSQMQITRVMVAHRPETVNSAGRRVHLQEGQIIGDYLIEAGDKSPVAQIV
jgi:ATP-binding cassette subfamily B protein RaxB